MMIVKLHKSPKPYLGKGSYVVPIFSWHTNQHLVNQWKHILDWYNQESPNNKVHFMTLAHLPDELPVSLHFDWIDRHLTFVPWKDHPLHDIAMMQNDVAHDRLILFGKKHYYRGEDLCAPEMVLGGAIPPQRICWTKDIRLLRGGDKRNKRTRIKNLYNQDTPIE